MNVKEVMCLSFGIGIHTYCFMSLWALPWLLNFALIVPSCPGAIGSLGLSAIVQPQVPLASEIIKGLLPVFLNFQEISMILPSLIFPRSWWSNQAIELMV